MSIWNLPALTSRISGSLFAQAPQYPSRLTRFSREDGGGMIVFTLFLLVCMLLAVGMSLDTVRAEYMRSKLQNTLDRAVLAAADLEQTLLPEDVVEDYFDRAGLSQNLAEVVVDEGINHRTVRAESFADLPTIFLDMVGIETLRVAALGTANESKSDLEIVMVLDNSGSMGQNDNLRMNLLKPAAKDFVDSIMATDTPEATTSISIVPFATQVTVGEDLLGYYNVTNEHDYSHCVTFSDADFSQKSIDPNSATPMQRTAHFDADYKSWTVNSSRIVCSTNNSREIAPWASSAAYLKSRIDAMTAGGWTSIEVGTKWGLALLDPSSRSILNDMVTKGTVAAELKDQPFGYDREGTMKILIVMSDGENTNQYDIKDPYRSGNSPLYHYRYNGNDYYSYYYNRSGSYDYYSVYHSAWRTSPVGSDNATRLTWPEVWADMTVKRFTDDIKAKALGESGSTYYNQIVNKITAGTKNPRTSKICTEAKDAGVTVFTIGMDTYGQGDATLADCASSISYFFDVRSVDISNAFASIARQINQLRLTN